MGVTEGVISIAVEDCAMNNYCVVGNTEVSSPRSFTATYGRVYTIPSQMCTQVTNSMRFPESFAIVAYPMCS